MAEFVEVMRQAKRMCAAHGGMCNSRNCPLDNGEACRLAADQDGVDYNDVERIIMAWAAEHPAQRYPTWREWRNKMFDGWEFDINPCIFASHSRFNCNEVKTCWECANKPIPADIAEKLGIKPINDGKDVPAHDGCEGCRWMDKHEDEEPCKNCCGVMGGSAPDLWEER